MEKTDVEELAEILNATLRPNERAVPILWGEEEGGECRVLDRTDRALQLINLLRELAAILRKA